MSYIHAQRVIIAVLIVSFMALGTVSILAIWEVIGGEDLIWKSLTTSLVIGMVGGVILACLKFLDEREQAALARK